MATKFRAKHYLELRLPTRPFLLEKTSEIRTLYDSVLIDRTAMLASLALNVVFVAESADVSKPCLMGSHSS